MNIRRSCSHSGRSCSLSARSHDGICYPRKSSFSHGTGLINARVKREWGCHGNSMRARVLNFIYSFEFHGVLNSTKNIFDPFLSCHINKLCIAFEDSLKSQHKCLHVIGNSHFKLMIFPSPRPQKETNKIFTLCFCVVLTFLVWLVDDKIRKSLFGRSNFFGNFYFRYFILIFW